MATRSSLNWWRTSSAAPLLVFRAELAEILPDMSELRLVCLIISQLLLSPSSSSNLITWSFLLLRLVISSSDFLTISFLSFNFSVSISAM